MKTNEYWAERAELRVHRAQMAADKTLKEIDRHYRAALREIEAEVQRLVLKYGKEYKLTYAEAMKAIDSSEFKDWRMTLADYVERINKTGDTELLRELDTLAMRSRISRYTELETAIKVNMAELRAREEQAVRELLEQQYRTAYYRQLHELQTGLGFGKNFAMLTPDDVGDALTYPWSGATFSSRVWGDTQRLSGVMRETMTQGLIQGTSVQKMTRALDDIMGKGRANAARLVRTEVAYIAEQGALRGYIEAGIEHYKILATLDSRTSPICQEQDGKVYAIKDAVVSVNYPPFHPHCRTTTVAHFNDEALDKGMRAAKDGKNGYYLVPSDMRYKDWREKYVDNRSDSGIIIIGDEVTTGAFGAIPKSDFRRRNKHAELYYEEIRGRTGDVAAIARNTSFAVEDVQKIKEHVFYNVYDLGEPEPTRFDADYHMAVSWQRLIDGNDIRDMDIVLLEHELYEYQLMQKERLPYQQAHVLAEEKYNYRILALEADE